MNIINLPPILPGELDLTAINQRLQAGEANLDWSMVKEAPEDDLAVLLASLNLVEHSEILGIETVPDSLSDVVLRVLLRPESQAPRPGERKQPANEGVSLGSSQGLFYALNAQTGAKLWTASTGMSGYYTSPSVSYGVVYAALSVSFSGVYNLYAYNAQTGATLWSVSSSSAFSSTPSVANGIVYVSANDSKIYAYNAQTGAKSWNATTGNRILSTPGIANGVVYIGSYYPIGTLQQLAGKTQGMDQTPSHAYRLTS